jgi:hypothetical protein
MGCTLAQGFFLGAPVPGDSVPRLFDVTGAPALAAPAAELPPAETSLGDPPLADSQ